MSRFRQSLDKQTFLSKRKKEFDSGKKEMRKTILSKPQRLRWKILSSTKIVMRILKIRL